MSELIDRQEIEAKIAAVNEWIGSFKVEPRSGADGLTEAHIDIEEIDTNVLRAVLTKFGADFNPEKEGFMKLSQPTNKHRRPGMNAVWGEDVIDNYNKWTVCWADSYEEKGRRLPKLQQSGNRTSGMRHFLGEMTAYAAGVMPFEVYKERTEARMVNGYTYSRGLGKTATDFLPDNKKYPGSIPSGFTEDVWNVIKSKELIRGVPEVNLE